jgi:hypothetical protein
MSLVKCKKLVLIFILVSLCAVEKSASLKADWEEFKQKYGKFYINEIQEAHG